MMKISNISGPVPRGEQFLVADEREPLFKMAVSLSYYLIFELQGLPYIYSEEPYYFYKSF